MLFVGFIPVLQFQWGESILGRRLKWAFLFEISPSSCCILFTFLSSFPEPQDQFQQNWAQSILGLNSENTLTKFKSLLLLLSWPISTKIWHKAFLAKGNFLSINIMVIITALQKCVTWLELFLGPPLASNVHALYQTLTTSIG